jgi:predicted alpha/beta superfamily hydrolase
MSLTTTLKSAIGAVAVLCFCSTLRAADADAPAPAKDTVTITFKVKPAPGTATDAKLYLAGDAKALGEWKADGFKLTRGEDGIYSGKVQLPRDKQVEYKVTRGSWETVEKNGDGSEINNRTLTPTKDATVEIEVKKWADTAKVETGEKPPEKKSTRSGDIRVHATFPSKFVATRDILVYLPSGYERDSDRRYPVLYMHDGQNVFDAATSFAGVEWRADETATRLIQEDKIEPLIIVAIANTPHRMDEYTLDHDKRRDQGSGAGLGYMKFVTEEVKPFIDKTYRTRPDRNSTAVGGSSLGGLISLELCRCNPQVFGSCMAMSPALAWADYATLERIERDKGWIKDCRFWIDAGTREGDAQANQNAMVGGVLRLEAKLIWGGLKKGEGYELLIVDGAQHNEAAWADRLDKALMFLFPPQPLARPPYNPGNGHSTPTPAPDPAAPHDVAAR